MTFGEQLKRLRISLNLTQEELGEDFSQQFGYHFSKQCISQYENNKRMPDIKVLINFSKYFEVSLDYLLALSDINHFNSNNSSITKVNQLMSITTVVFNDEKIDFDDKTKIFSDISNIAFKSMKK